MLEVEEGEGLSTATSYASVAFADDYMQANIQNTAWAEQDTETKQNLLMWASRYLDQRAVWNGKRAKATSGLRWPRIGVHDRDGTLIEQDEIPQQLQEAVVEMARYLLVSDRALERGQDGLKRLKVDVIEIEFDKNYRQAEIPNEIHHLLMGLGALRSGLPNYARIRRA